MPQPKIRSSAWNDAYWTLEIGGLTREEAIVFELDLIEYMDKKWGVKNAGPSIATRRVSTPVVTQTAATPDGKEATPAAAQEAPPADGSAPTAAAAEVPADPAPAPEAPPPAPRTDVDVSAVDRGPLIRADKYQNVVRALKDQGFDSYEKVLAVVTELQEEGSVTLINRLGPDLEKRTRSVCQMLQLPGA